MEIYILRHGEAEPRGPGVVEEKRALTSRGHRDVRLVVKRLRKVLEPEIILTSPLMRARETAEEARTAWPRVRMEETELLKPDAQAAALCKELQKRKLCSVLLVGHQPHLGHLVNYLLGADLQLDFKKGALLRIDADSAARSPRGVLRWIVTPKLARAMR